MDHNQLNDGSQGGFPGGNNPPYHQGWNQYMYGYQRPPPWLPQGYMPINPNVSMMQPSPQVLDPAENTNAAVQQDDKDLEEIPASSAPKGKQKRIKQSKFCPEEDKNLVMSWLEISNDPIQANAQRKEGFWGNILQRYNMRRGSYPERTLKSLQSRWDTIKAEVGKFASAFADVVRENPSGMSDADKTTHAAANFASFWGHNFQFLNCWEIMKDEPKWQDPKTKANAQSARGHGFGEHPINLEDDNPDPNASAEKRPMGRDRAKALKNKANSDAGSASSSDYASRMQDLSLQKMTMMQEESARKNERFQRMVDVEQQRYEEMRSHHQSLLLVEENKVRVEEEKVRVEQEKVRIMREKHDRETEEKEKQEDERIMRIDLDTLPPGQRAYYQALQEDIMEKVQARRRKRPEH